MYKKTLNIEGQQCHFNRVHKNTLVSMCYIIKKGLLKDEESQGTQ